MGVLNWSGAISCFLALEKGSGMNKRARPFSADRAKPYVMRIGVEKAMKLRGWY